MGTALRLGIADRALVWGWALYLVAACAEASSDGLGSVRFEHLGVNDGLSQSSVNALLQDRRGYLWIATQDGLNRYDGYRFEVFRNDPANPRSLASNHVLAVLEDRDGVLWVATSGGILHRYRRDSADFERVRIDLPVIDGSDVASDAPPQPPRVDVRSILEAADGRLLLATGGQGVLSFDSSTGELTRLALPEDRRIHALAEGLDAALWTGSSRGLVRVAGMSGTAGPESPSSVRLLTDEIRTLAVLPDGQVWAAGRGNTIHRFTATGDALAAVRVAPVTDGTRGEFRTLMVDSRGRLWAGMIGGGLHAFDAEGNLLESFAHSPSDLYTLASDTVYTLLEDRAGVIWVGSLAAGLSKAIPRDGGFAHLRHVPGVPTSLAHNMVNEFAEDAVGGVWVGSSGGGVSYLPSGSADFVHFRADPADPARLSSDRVWGMHLAPDQALWVGTWGAGLNRLDLRDGTVRRFQWDADRPESLPGSIVTAIVGDGQGGIFIGMADAGVAQLPASSDVFRRLTLPVGAPDGSLNVSALSIDRRGRLWVGTWERGVCLSDTDVAQFQCHAHDPLDHRSINDDNIRSIAEDGLGGVWLATGNGIARYDESSRSFDRFTSAAGLVPGVIYAIVPADDGVLWVSSNRGLMRYDTRERQGRHYEYRDGLQANEFNGDAALKTRSGHILFGGVGGITRFHPEELRDDPVPPSVVITGFSLFNRPVSFEAGRQAGVLSRPVSETEAITLRHDQNFIGFEFAALHFAQPMRNLYAYMLEGVDPDWTQIDASRRFASYANLRPGRYLFRVRAANSDGVWSVEDARMHLIITPPWWLTWWALSLYVLIGLAMISLFVRWRLRSLQAQTVRLASEVQKRTSEVVAQKETIERQAIDLRHALASKDRFFAQLSHEFRTPITLILGPIDETLRAGTTAPATRALTLARHSGERLLHLVDQLLSLAGHGGHQHVERAPMAVAPVVRLIVAEFDSAARQKSLELILEILDTPVVASNDHALQAILINLVSNAIKYTPAGGSITVSLRRKGDEAVLSVADTGIGIAEADLVRVFELFERGAVTGQGTGIGLTVVRELVDAHEGSIGIDSAPGVGTTVTVRLPALNATLGAEHSPPHALNVNVETFLTAAQSEPGPLLSAPTSDDVDDPSGTGDEIGGRPEVLVVDDNDDMRCYVVELLAAQYRCVQAADGEAGLALAFERVPDAIVCDVMMPGLDGFELLKRLRADDRTSHVPIVMLTARGDEASRLQGLDERADDYLAKPFNADELRLRLRNLLELGELRAERVRRHVLERPVESALRAPPPGLAERDRRFIDRITGAAEAHFADPDFGAIELAGAVFMGPRQLQRKLKALLDINPAAYLREFRLNKARDGLEAGKPVTDVAHACGFSSPSHFSQSFKARFGVRPSEWRPTE